MTVVTMVGPISQRMLEKSACVLVVEELYVYEFVYVHMQFGISHLRPQMPV